MSARCSAVAQVVAEQSIAVGAEKVVLLCWADYADTIFRPLQLTLQRRGVRVVTQRWTDANLLDALNRWPSDEVARLWAPMEPNGMVRVPNNRFVAADRVVSLWSLPITESGEPAALKSGLDAAILAGTRSLAKIDGDAAAKLVLVEWPRGCRKDLTMDLSYDDVTALYLDAMKHDANAIRQTNSAVSARVRGAKFAHLSCPLGTDLHLDTQGREWKEESMAADAHNGPIYVPGGEVYVAVQEHRTHGQLAFGMGGHTCRLTIRDGIPVELTTPSAKLTKLLEHQLALGTEPVSELGIGTNPSATAQQIGSLCEKALGTVHVAVGANQHLGGKHRSTRHVDLMVHHPTLSVDGACIVDNGQFWWGKSGL